MKSGALSIMQNTCHWNGWRSINYGLVSQLEMNAHFYKFVPESPEYCLLTMNCSVFTSLTLRFAGNIQQEAGMDKASRKKRKLGMWLVKPKKIILQYYNNNNTIIILLHVRIVWCNFHWCIYYFSASLKETGSKDDWKKPQYIEALNKKEQ